MNKYCINCYNNFDNERLLDSYVHIYFCKKCHQFYSGYIKISDIRKMKLEKLKIW